MKKTINFYDFVKAFDEMGRKETFSQKGLKALFNYIEQYEEDTGVEIEFDVIALCGEFTEYSDFEEFKWYYNDYVAQHNIKNLDDLEDHTIVIRVDNNSFIIQKTFKGCRLCRFLSNATTFTNLKGDGCKSRQKQSREKERR